MLENSTLKSDLEKYIKKLEKKKDEKIECIIDTEKNLSYHTLQYKKISFWEYGFDFEKKTEENKNFNLKIKIEKIDKDKKEQFFLIGKIESLDNSSKILAVNNIGEDFVKFGYNSGGHKICIKFITEYQVKISTIYYDEKNKECFYYWTFKDFKLVGSKTLKNFVFEIYFKF